jgi:hypothetical protein
MNEAIITRSIALYPTARKACPACPIDASIREAMEMAIKELHCTTVEDCDLELFGAEFDEIAERLLATSRG